MKLVKSYDALDSGFALYPESSHEPVAHSHVAKVKHEYSCPHFGQEGWWGLDIKSLGVLEGNGTLHHPLHGSVPAQYHITVFMRNGAIDGVGQVQTDGAFIMKQFGSDNTRLELKNGEIVSVIVPEVDPSGTSAIKTSGRIPGFHP